jgi:hypothetical protein
VQIHMLHRLIELPHEYHKYLNSVRQPSTQRVQHSACPALRVEMRATEAHIIRFMPALDSSADLWPAVYNQLLGGTCMTPKAAKSLLTCSEPRRCDKAEHVHHHQQVLKSSGLPLRADIRSLSPPPQPPSQPHPHMARK